MDILHKYNGRLNCISLQTCCWQQCYMDIAAGASVQHRATVRVGTRHMPTCHLESNVGVGI